jgi:transcriptional regulator with XRE-family HTH domain
MPFQPNSLPYKLRKLFDANVCAPSDIARSLGIPVSNVDRWLRGRSEPDVVTRVQLDKILSFYTRRANRHLKLEIEDGEESPAPSVRGVFEVDREFPGVRSFHVVTAKGEKRLQILAPASDVNELLLEFMGEWLNFVDPPLQLFEGEQPSAP